ncbi:uncharacterized protein MEPE_02861 [Melanopsichium pennsylvanicum]|uniref:Transcription activator of gluconeogenesis ERT1 n=2 Tax=Melanopsichium pennsylvanicum TaxID=63383 RepID=A0AAJ4XL66_9BASI|nr:putative protein [Melanopsichium pennsylvanicum 4]SNX84153.1 uncharacterized protein MEPE_02861 [Melanopsichium pennsylvanicum]
MSSGSGAPIANMTYGMAPPMHPHHFNQAADSSIPNQNYGGHQQQISQYGASQVGSNFAYSNQSFYGHPAQHPAQHHQDASQQQHAGYYSHHTSSPQMDPNGQLYAAHQMSHPDMMNGGQLQGHQQDLLAHQHGYAAFQAAGVRPKRKQVKNACVNCQKACKKCDEGRPCGRCVKYGLVDTCQDSARKERRRGIKRGPYKRRATTGSQPTNPSLSVSGPMSSSYGRDGHISPSSRSDGMLGSTHGGESSFSSPAFGTQVLASRPPMPLQMPSNGGWQGSATSPVDDREGLRARYGQPIANNQYYGYEQDAAHHTYDRSSSTPINQPGGSMLSPVGRFPSSATPQSSNSQLPSLGSHPSSNGSYVGGVYGSGNGRMGGMSNVSTSSLISPPLHSSASNTSFLSASSAPNGIAHHRLHSDSSLATLSSNGASSSTMSPRTPLNGPGAEPPLLSPSGNKLAGVTPPQPTVPTVSGTFLQQDTSRPFPLKMPKAPTRGRSGTGSSYLDQQQGSYYGANNLAPINVKFSNSQQQQPQQQQAQQFQRGSPYMAVQSINNDDRRQFVTPRMDKSPNAGLMSIKADRDVAGAPPPAPAGSLGFA